VPGTSTLIVGVDLPDPGDDSSPAVNNNGTAASRCPGADPLIRRTLALRTVLRRRRAESGRCEGDARRGAAGCESGAGPPCWPTMHRLRVLQRWSAQQ
jgi:hypothetical protein